MGPTLGRLPERALEQDNKQTPAMSAGPQMKPNLPIKVINWRHFDGPTEQLANAQVSLPGGANLDSAGKEAIEKNGENNGSPCR